MSVFLVERALPGFEVGAKERKMGRAPGRRAALRWRRAAKDARLGPENRGFHMMMGVLDKGRIGIAALAVGILQAALEAAVDYARTRRQFGQAIAQFQGVQWLLADMAKDTAAARLLTHAAATRLDGGARATMEAAMAKCFARCRGPPYVERGADLRRGRVHPRFRGRAPVSRRQDHPDLRGHQPDPAQHHRAAPVGDMTDTAQIQRLPRASQVLPAGSRAMDDPGAGEERRAFERAAHDRLARTYRDFFTGDRSGNRALLAKPRWGRATRPRCGDRARDRRGCRRRAARPWSAWTCRP